MMSPLKTLATLISLLFYLVAIGQDCRQNFNEANRAYFNGNFEEVISLLSSCKDSESINRSYVYELLIKSHLILNQLKKAEDLMKSLLRNDPLYVPGNFEIVEYKNLFEKYDVFPTLRFGLTTGFTIPHFDILQYHSYGGTVDRSEDYDAETGFLAGVSASKYFNESFSFTFDLLYQRFSYRSKEQILNYQNIEVRESMAFLTIPVQVRYQLRKYQVNPFFSMGIASHFRLASNADIQVFANQSDVLIPFIGVPNSTRNYDLSQQRRFSTFSYIGSLGIQKEFGTFQLEVILSYERGIQNQVKKENRYDDEFLIQQFSYVPDDFRIDNYSLRVSIYKMIYTLKAK